MQKADNTLFLRLAGPMQSWGTSSRFQIRRTDRFPSKSGVLGMLCCAMGIKRADVPARLTELGKLQMGVRIDIPGAMEWDFHSAGAGLGMRTSEGKIKVTAKSGAYETLLSRRQYLMDASFLVALSGDSEVVQKYRLKLEDPAWPMYLGRKCCIPSEPVAAGGGYFKTLSEALAVKPIPFRRGIVDGDFYDAEIWVEHPVGFALPDNAIKVYDQPENFGYFGGYRSRWLVPGRVQVRVEKAQAPWEGARKFRHVNYSSSQWRSIREKRLDHDDHLCVFCKAPAEQVHHVTYRNAGNESIDDLRSLCRLCHDACTLIEYATGLETYRIDPANPAERTRILEQINLLLKARKSGKRRSILQQVREHSFF